MDPWNYDAADDGEWRGSPWAEAVGVLLTVVLLVVWWWLV